MEGRTGPFCQPPVRGRGGHIICQGEGLCLCNVSGLELSRPQSENYT